jgi:hypothetical protein
MAVVRVPSIHSVIVGVSIGMLGMEVSISKGIGPIGSD